MWLKSEQPEHVEVRRLITEDKVRPDDVRSMKLVLWMRCWLPSSCALFRLLRPWATSSPFQSDFGATGELNHWWFDPEYKKRFMHIITSCHTCGETGRYGAPGRRETAARCLGEACPAQVLPSLKNSHTPSVWQCWQFLGIGVCSSSLYLCRNACLWLVVCQWARR